MEDYLHHLPNLLILAVTVVLFGGAAFASPFLGRMLGSKHDRSRDAALFDAFLAVMAMAGIVLAFSLVQADGNLRTDEDHIGREASAIIAADRALQRIGLPGAPAARALLSGFVQSQLRDEWPTLAERGRDVRTDRHYGAMSDAVSALEPQSPRQQVIYAELIKSVDTISDVRETLVEDAGMHLPAIFWVVSAGFVMLGLVLGFLSEASLSRAAALAVTAAGIGLLFAFVLIVDRPFQGKSALRPGAIATALSHPH